MRATVTTELLSRDGRVLKKEKQPSRSLLFGFPKILYSIFTNTNWCHPTLGTMDSFRMDGQSGRGLMTTLSGNWPWSAATAAYQPSYVGEMWGIQISEDNTALTPFDSYIRGRLGHARGHVRCEGLRCSFYGMASDRRQSLWSNWIATSQRIQRRYLAQHALNAITFVTPNNRNQMGLTFDGEYLWMGNATDSLIHRMDPLTGVVNLQWATPAAAQRALAWDYDTSQIWSGDNTTKRLYRHNPADGVVAQNFQPGVAGVWGDMDILNGYIYLCDFTNNIIHIIDPVAEAIVAAEDVSALPWASGIGSIAFVGPYWVIADYSHDTTPRNAYIYCMPEYGFHQPNLEIAGMEIDYPVIANPNGEFTIRRIFRNNTGAGLTIRKVGIQCGQPCEAIAVDLLAAPVAVANGEDLRVSYTFEITV